METKIEVDQLKQLYMEAKDSLTPESESIHNNITEVFWQTVADKVQQKELVNISVRGEVATGKSTVAIKVAYEINKLLLSLKKHDEIDMNKTIFSDQTEFLRFINDKISHICITIDEFNRMASTGLNATTETALFDYYSDVFAQKYIHRVSCSPATITDKNATIVLDVIGRDVHNKITRCKVLYRNVIEHKTLCLGHTDIYVGDVIEQQFYLNYRQKKFKRMDLLEKHGVRDIRELEYSTIILESLHELQDLSKVQKVPQEIVLSVVDEVRRRHKRIYSLLTLNEINTKVRGILTIFTQINTLAKKRAKHKTSAEEITIYTKTIEQLQDILKKRIEEQENLRSIYHIYITIQ